MKDKTRYLLISRLSLKTNLQHVLSITLIILISNISSNIKKFKVKLNKGTKLGRIFCRFYSNEAATESLSTIIFLKPKRLADQEAG